MKDSIDQVKSRLDECIDRQRKSREAIMCSKSAAQTVTRVATGVATFGTSEIARKIPGASTLASLPENAAGTAYDIVSPPKPPSSAGGAQSSDQPAADQGPLPTAQNPDVTTVAAQARRRRLAALRQGIMSTIATSGQGVGGSPVLLTPTAVAGKTKLGQ
jgi:hypothetical protein